MTIRTKPNRQCEPWVVTAGEAEFIVDAVSAKDARQRVARGKGKLIRDEDSLTRLIDSIRQDLTALATA